MAAQQNNSNPNFTDINSIFSAAILILHNARSLQASVPHSHAKSISCTFLQTNTILPARSADVLQLQEVGRIWCPQLLLKPDLELASYSVDDNNAFASIAMYYCHRRWNLLEAEVLLAGRFSSHLMEGKAHKNMLLTFNVYGPPNHLMPTLWVTGRWTESTMPFWKKLG